MNSQLNGVHFLFVPTVLVLLYCSMAPNSSIAVAEVLNIDTDQSSLLAFNDHISYDPSNILAKNWSIEIPICNWIGITCGSSHLRVTAVNLSYMGLVGTIPPHLENLSFITKLVLDNNSFHGSLPSELSRLRRLKLISISFNNFSGEIPSWFVLLPKIETLWLDHNSFTGHVIPSLFNITSLRRLDLQGNKLWGLLPSNFFQAPLLQFVSFDHNHISGSIPSAVSNISSLQIISLNNNSLSGEVPKNIFSYLPNLRYFGLSRNDFSGEILPNLFSCKELQSVFLEENSFTGSIPREIGNLTKLERMYIYQNKLEGTIPNEIENLHNLRIFGLVQNNLRGKIPIEIFNISTIEEISLSFNQLSGSLPSTLGSTAPNLKWLMLGGNYFSGKIPSSLSNASMLIYLDLFENSFSGYIPNVFSNLRMFESLNLPINKLTSDPELSIINSLSSCKNLNVLILSENPLNSILPMSIGNLSTSLEWLEFENCGMMGSIPENIDNLSSLMSLDLGENKFTGTIPAGIGNLQELQFLSINGNTLEGRLPSVICQLKSLWQLDLGNNIFSGSIPTCIGNLTFLRHLSLATNKFNMAIPSDLLGLTYLLSLDLSLNELTGFFPSNIANLKVVREIYLSDNQFSGNIPSNIGLLQDLVNLSLARNQLQGLIPESLGSMLSLEHLDLSMNHLSGIVPKSLEALMHLKSFNVSYNKLEGEIPSGGSFKNFSALSFIGNEGLCGPPGLQVPSCKPTASSKSHGTKAIALKIVLPIVFATILTMIFLYMLKWKKNSKPSDIDEDSVVTTWRRISYHELQEATNKFNDVNLLGTGSFGKVYKGILTDGTNIAVKVFNLDLEGGCKSFDSECEVLRNARHRNLVKIISSCSNNVDFKALVLSYMPNGSLERWLYSDNCCLSIIQKMNIMIDVAAALDYLHHGCSIPIVHCDLKPNNILLDQDMVAHITDFGIAKLLDRDSITHTMTLATMGYMAPEYGLEGNVSRQGDVYSYGILLIETFTGKKPTNEFFHGEFGIKQWVKDSNPDLIIEVIDRQLLIKDEAQLAVKKECILSIMGLALVCSADSPSERGNMNDVLAALKKIRNKFLNEPKIPVASV